MPWDFRARRAYAAPVAAGASSNAKNGDDGRVERVFGDFLTAREAGEGG